MPLRSPTFGIRHSAAFRMTLRFTAFFIAGLMGVGLVAGLIARTNIERSARAAASDMVQDLAASYAHFTPEDFARYLEGIAGALSEDGVFVGYQAPGGEPLSGAITLPRPTTGWSDYLVDGSDVDEILWVRTERLPDGHWLSVGATTEYYNDAVELMTDGVLWVVAISVPLALFSGALLSRMVLSRLDDLSGTAEAVSAGDLSQRAPLRGTADRSEERRVGKECRL